MDWTTLGDWGLVALGIAVLGLPVQVALGFALGVGRRGPVSVALLLPVLVLVLGLAGVNHGYAEVQKALFDPPDPAWAPWYALYDRSAAASPAPLTGVLTFVLTVPALVGAAVASLRHHRRGNIGPLIAATAGLLAGVALVAVGVRLGRPALVLPGLLYALITLLSAASLAALRPNTLAIPGLGVAGGVVASLGLVVTTFGSLEVDVTDTLDDLTAAAGRMDELAVHESMAHTLGLVLLAPPVVAGAVALPGLGFIRARDAGPRQGLDIAATGALLGGGALTLVWVLVRRSLVGRLAGAHAAWVLAAAPGYDVPHREVLPPRVLVPAEGRSTWMELHEGGGAKRWVVEGGMDIVGKGLARGDGVILPRTWLAEDLYYLVIEAPAGEILLVGCAPVPAASAAMMLREPLLAVGRCGGFPLKLRVAGGMPNPRELILVPGPHVQDGFDVIDLGDLTDIAGRDVVLRLQVDCTVSDIVAGLEALRGAANVYLGWGVTTEGDDLTIGVEPGLRVVEHLPGHAGAAVAPAPAAPPANDPAAILAAP